MARLNSESRSYPLDTGWENLRIISWYKAGQWTVGTRVRITLESWMFGDVAFLTSAALSQFPVQEALPNIWRAQTRSSKTVQSWRLRKRCISGTWVQTYIQIVITYHHHWQNSPFRATAFLRRFCQIWYDFHFFAFRNNNSFYRARSSSVLRPTPDLEDQVPVFMCPSDTVAQLHPQAPGSLFVAFYDSQGCGGGILTRLHTGT
jgi:hypothetical protein